MRTVSAPPPTQEQRLQRPRPDRPSAAVSPALPVNLSRRASSFTKRKSHTTSGSSFTTSPRTRPAPVAQCLRVPRRQGHRLEGVLPGLHWGLNLEHSPEHSPALSSELPAQTAD